MKTKLRNAKGFTIIEVLIVLAIAGLIMLLVFLAVPALQRNNRNTGRRSDASRISSAAANFVTNSNGATPSLAADVTAIISDAGTLSQFSNLTAPSAAAGNCGSGGAIPFAAAGGGGSAAPILTVCKGGTTGAFTAPAAGSAILDGMVLGTGVQCNGTNQFSAGSSRQMALIYTQETQSAPYTVACLNV